MNTSKAIFSFWVTMLSVIFVSILKSMWLTWFDNTQTEQIGTLFLSFMRTIALSLSLYLSLSSNTIVPTKGKKGNGLCTVKVITRHIRIWTLAQEWTHVRNPTCPVITFTRHKPHPKKKSTCQIVSTLKKKKNTYTKHTIVLLETWY